MSNKSQIDQAIVRPDTVQMVNDQGFINTSVQQNPYQAVAWVDTTMHAHLYVLLSLTLLLGSSYSTSKPGIPSAAPAIATEQ
ncbi:hypothetical protein [Pseudomonas sp. Irchel s3f7]|uniref:hypothetical protein n=1 Tax=Pseudomonas sp. Irchel s3f7 TaxID=2009153 RepID=UPI002113AD55|nr:hypothetical protein [Pseudomonas sp. Irchel s3f7]